MLCGGVRGAEERLSGSGEEIGLGARREKPFGGFAFLPMRSFDAYSMRGRISPVYSFHTRGGAGLNGQKCKSRTGSILPARLIP